MNRRQIELIEILCRHNSLRLLDLAARLSVTERTIRSDIDSINKTCNKHGIGYISFGDKGTVIVPRNFEKLKEMYALPNPAVYKMTREERVLCISAILISETRYITAETLADYFFVSKTSLYHDLSPIRDCLEKAALKLVSLSGKGIKVEGSQIRRRHFLVNFAIEHPYLSKIWQAYPCNLHVFDYMPKVRKILHSLVRIYSVDMDDLSFQKIVLYFCITIDAIQRGAISTDEKWIRGQTLPTDAFERELVALVGQYTSTYMGENELYNLHAAKDFISWRSKKHFPKDYLPIKKLTRVFIQNISRDLSVNLNNDWDLFEFLSNHLESMFCSPILQYASNPEVEAMIRHYPHIIRCVRNNRGMLERYVKRKLNQQELAYIVIHIAAAIERASLTYRKARVVIVCNAGVGTSQLLATQIRKAFNVEIKEILAAHTIESIKYLEADLVISTVALTHCPVDHIVVSLPLHANDYQKIRAYLNSAIEFRDKCEKDNLPTLHQLLPENHIKLNQSCSTWQEAIRLSAAPLLAGGYIEERYITAMIEEFRHQKSYLVIAPDVALPHSSPENGCKKLGMSFIRVNNAVNFGTESSPCPIKFIFCLSAIDRKTHLKALGTLFDMCTQPNLHFLKRLETAPDTKSVTKIISECEIQLSETVQADD